MSARPRARRNRHPRRLKQAATTTLRLRRPKPSAEGETEKCDRRSGERREPTMFWVHDPEEGSEPQAEAESASANGHLNGSAEPGDEVAASEFTAEPDTSTHSFVSARADAVAQRRGTKPAPPSPSRRAPTTRLEELPRRDYRALRRYKISRGDQAPSGAARPSGQGRARQTKARR